MNMRKLLPILLLMLVAPCAMAQMGGVTGRILSRAGRTPIAGVAVKTTPATSTDVTDAEGCFTLDAVPNARYMISFSAPGFETLDMTVEVEDTTKDLYTIVMLPEMETTIVDDSIFAEFDTDFSTDGMSAPATLSASKDIFSNIASYKFSEMRFSPRGYDSQYSDVYLNGIKMNDALSGYSPWSLWSGLNDATRNQETTTGLNSSNVGLGGLNGTTHILARATQLRHGWSTSLVNANNMYRFRAMVTYSSGMNEKGWAYAFSLATRQGGNDYINGIYYNTLGYFASVEKQFSEKSLLSFTFFGAPTERGAQQASTQEAYDLLGNNYYNPNVGVQNGEYRNTRVKEYHEPIAVLNYRYDLSEATQLNLATSFRFGQNGYSALTWNAGSDPRPDYYRYLPSYYNCPNPGQLAEQWMSNTDNISLINFDDLYNINYNGEVNPMYGEGRRAAYMIEERHTDQRDANFAANLQHTFRSGSTLFAGVNARRNRTENYSTVKDLMGGDYWVDVDKFAERDFGSNELAYQNNLEYYYAHGHAEAVTEGDKYNYDYFSHVTTADIWGTYNHVFGFAPNLSASISGEVGYSSMWREGLWCKGLFKNNSYGNSEKLNYLTYSGKAHLGYKFNRIFGIEANAAYMNNAPTFQSAFISPRTRNSITPGIDTEKVMAFDAAFNARFNDYKFRLAAYYTNIKDQSKVISFYNDLQSSYDNFAMSGIDKRYMGIEAALSVPIYAGISFNSAVSLGNYIYNSNPNYIEMVDNSATPLSGGSVDWKGMKIESTPQTAINLGLGYRSPNYLFLALDFNIYDNRYLSMNPLYRTDSVLTQYMIQNGLDKSMREQEKFDQAYTLNASVGKSWYINREYNLGLSFEVKNILNRQDMKSGGYEQMRVSDVLDDAGDLIGYKRFDSKYFYMLGRTYYLNVYLRF